MIFQPGRHGATKVATLETDEQSARTIAGLVDEGLCGAGAAIELVDNGGGSWRVALHARAASDESEVRDLIAAAVGPAAAKALRFRPLAAKDWLHESLAGLTPVHAGRFVVHGSHDRGRVAENRIGIEIEAALAFGTGHHGTTRGCLLALDGICRTISTHQATVRRHPEVRAKRASKGGGPSASAPSFEARATRGHLRMTKKKHILDLGTGSGVLAIAAARALRLHVLATDIDPEAVHVARANARLNGVGPLITTLRAEGVTALPTGKRFDLVFANILLGPLQRFAAALIKLTAPGARVILSGLLAAQANAALAAYRPLALERRITLDGWTTLVLRRR
ncbi:MAG: 50S ribosomal protein L11 methyltransferase [Xanthobacteraceae bacterium]